MDSYREEVQSYTSSQIGAKISLNTPKFKESDIQNGDLTLKTTALFRVVTKWVEEL